MNDDNKQKLLIYLIVIFTIVAAILLTIFGIKFLSDSCFLTTLILSVSGGMIGGSIYMGRGFYQSIAEIENTDRKFNFNRWIWWYLLRPFLSAIAGGIIFLIIYTAFDLQESTKNQIAFFLLGLFAGYNFHDFAEHKLGILSKSFLAKKKN